MSRLCIEVADKASPFAGRRGLVATRTAKTMLVHLDHEYNAVRFTPKQLLAVYTLGLPREARMRVQGAKWCEAVVERALASIDTTKFLLLHLGSDEWHHFLKVRTAFVERALATAVEQNREPLLRVYVGAYSQNDPGARVIFTDSIGEYDDAGPAWADLDAESVVQVATLSEAGGAGIGEFNRTLLLHNKASAVG